MFNFITVRILAWVIAAIFACAVVSTFVYYHKGLKVGENKLELYKLTVKAVGEAQAIQTKRVIIEQQLIATEANDEATKLRAALTNYFNDPRVHVDYGTRVRKLPSVPNATKRVDAPAAESPLDTSGVEANVTVGSKAANDALTILLLQKWIEENVALRP